MKRKLFQAMVLFSCSALLLAGCGTKDTRTEPPGSNGSQQDGSGDTDKDASSSPDKPLGNETPDRSNGLEFKDFEAMVKAVDALIQNCYENDCDYDSKDPVFFWNTLYLGIVNHTREVPLAKSVDGEIQVPRMAVQEFATGLFSDYQDLPKLPESLTNIRYSTDWDAYIFSPGERSTTYTRLISAIPQENGQIRLAAVLCEEDTDTPLCCYVFTLTPHAYADGIVEPIFMYSISSMTPSSAINCGDGLPTLIASYQGFIDVNTAEFKIDGNRMTFQVYDEEILSLLLSMDAGDEVTLAVKINETTETRIIQSLILK